MKIVVCDDDKNIVNCLVDNLNAYFDAKMISYATVNEFYKGEDVIKFVEEENNIDIILIDIEMSEVNGIYTVKLLKEKFPNLIVIFVTSYLKYAPDTFRVGAFQLIQKPIEKESFWEDLSRAMLTYESLHKEYTGAWKGETFVVEHKDICYIEGYRRHIFIVTKDKKYECVAKLSDLEKELGTDCFARTHQGYIVNLRYIKEINQTKIILKNDDTIPMSKQKKQDVMRLFSTFVARRR